MQKVTTTQIAMIQHYRKQNPDVPFIARCSYPVEGLPAHELGASISAEHPIK